MARLRAYPLPLLALAFGLCLFPFGWLSPYAPPVRFVADIVFATDAAHAVGHAAMFFALGCGLLAAMPALRHRPWRYAALMLGAGLAQELLQLLYKQRPVGFDEPRDLAMDLLGFGLALALARLLSLRGRA